MPLRGARKLQSFISASGFHAVHCPAFWCEEPVAWVGGLDSSDVFMAFVMALGGLGATTGPMVALPLAVSLGCHVVGGDAETPSQAWGQFSRLAR